MYRCSIELSARCDGQSESEREHASSIDKHARLRVFDSVANSSETLFQMIIGLMTVIIPGKYFFLFFKYTSGCDLEIQSAR